MNAISIVWFAVSNASVTKQSRSVVSCLSHCAAGVPRVQVRRSAATSGLFPGIIGRKVAIQQVDCCLLLPVLEVDLPDPERDLSPTEDAGFDMEQFTLEGHSCC